MTVKTCSVCKKTKSVSEFHKDKYSCDGYRNKCKECVSLYMKERFRDNKSVIVEKNREYYRENRDKILYSRRERRKLNVSKFRERNRKDYYKNREKRLKTAEIYRDKNRDKLKLYPKLPAKYDTYAKQISLYEEVRRDPTDITYIQVRCFEVSCNKWFNPTNSQIRSRIAALTGKKDTGNYRFYCSDECKQKCIFYNQIKYPKGYKPYTYTRKKQYVFRKTVLQRDNFRCRLCNSTDKLEVHHLFNYIDYAYMQTLPANGVTLCNTCHMQFHSVFGHSNNTIYQFFKFMKRFNILR